MNKKKYLQNTINYFLKNTEINNFDFSFIKADKNDIYNIPNSLFKYTPIKKYTMEMLEENTLYLAPAQKMDDQFDCSINYSKDYIIKLSDEEIKEKACIYYKDYLYKSKEMNFKGSFYFSIYLHF